MPGPAAEVWGSRNLAVGLISASLFMLLYIMQTLSDVRQDCMFPFWAWSTRAGWGWSRDCSELVVVAPSPMGFSGSADEDPLQTFVLTCQTISLRAQGLCESRRGRPGLPIPNGLYGLRGRKATLNEKSVYIQASSVLPYVHRDRTDH